MIVQDSVQGGERTPTEQGCFATSDTHTTASTECSDSKPNQTKLFQNILTRLLQ